MKPSGLILLSVFLCLALSVGCAPTPQGHGRPPGDQGGNGVHPSANAYYYYSEAHLNVKKGNVDHAVQLMARACEKDPQSVLLRRELASLLLMKKDVQAAIDVLEKVLKAHPEDVESLLMAGRIYQNRKNSHKAMEAYHRVLRLDPARQNIYLVLGGMYMDQERFDEAEQVYRELIEHFPEAYAGYFFLGRISSIRGDADQARSYYLKTMEIEPDLLETRFELGGLFESEKKYKQAAAIYEEVVAQHPDHVQGRMTLGHARYRLGQKKKAGRLFAALGEQSLENQEVIRVLVRHFLDAQDYEAAAIIIDGMLNGAPENSDLRYLAGVAQDGLENKQEAIDQFKQVAPDSRFFQNAVIHGALLCQELDQLTAAIEMMNTSIAKDPRNAEFYLYLGSFYEQAEAYAKANQALKKGLGVDPENPRLFFRMGVVQDKWGNKEASIAAMRQVIQYEPDNANALNYLGYTYADMGINLDEAEKLIRKALEYKPGDGYITDSLAWVFYKRGQYDKARPLLEEAAQLVPDDPIIQEHLGDVYGKLGMLDKARKSYHQSIENGHSDKAVVEKKIRLLTP